MLTKILDYIGFKKIDDWEDEIERLKDQIDSSKDYEEMWKSRYEIEVERREYWKREYELSMTPVYREKTLQGPAPIHVTIEGEK